MYLFAFLFLLFVNNALSVESPFCRHCSCSTGFVIACRSKSPDLQKHLYDNATWFDADTGKMYPYTTLDIENDLKTLDHIFPPSNLSHLDLSHNEISSITDSVFQNFQNMQILDLSRNKLEVIHPNAFQGIYSPGEFMPLKSLKNLYLSHNLIKTLDKDQFDHVTKLEYLDLSYNPLEELNEDVITAISELTSLKTLDLSYTHLKSMPDNFLHALKSLDTLYLSGNMFMGFPKDLEHAHSLTTLYFDDTSITSLTKENGLPRMDKLKKLHMCKCLALSKIGKYSLGGAYNLEELRICENPVLTSIEDTALAHLDTNNSTIYATLSKLYLENNEIEVLKGDLLPRWDTLVDLDISNNPWACETKNEWMARILMPIYAKIDVKKAEKTNCSSPDEMKKYTLYQIYKDNIQLRPADYYGAHPEKDAVMLVGVLAGVLITIPLVLFIILASKRNWFGLFDRSAAAYSRRFYRPSSLDGDF